MSITGRIFGSDGPPDDFCENDLEFYPAAHSYRRKRCPEEIQIQIMEQEEKRREQTNIL